jgi:methylglyoxal synthase
MTLEDKQMRESKIRLLLHKKLFVQDNISNAVERAKKNKGKLSQKNLIAAGTTGRNIDSVYSDI